MRILIVNLMLFTSENGLITRRKTNIDCMIYNFARGFVENGHTVTLCASEEYRTLEEETLPFKVIYFKSKFPRIFLPRLIPYPKDLRTFVKENVDKYDMVISNEIFQLSTLLIADICKEKLVIWQELSLHNKFFFKIPSKIWYNWVVTLSPLKKALVVSRSDRAKEFIRQYCDNVSDEIVEHGVNGSVLKPLNISESTFTILSRLSKLKNVDKIIRIFAKFVQKNNRYKDFVLNIIGDGPERQSLEKLVESLNIKSNVFFYGYLSHGEMSSILAKSKALLVNTSKDLNMVSIPEAISCGTPILMNTLPCTAQFVTKSHLGIAKDDWNENDLVEMVKNYDLFRANCINVREQLTNVGCARKMVDIFIKNKMTN